LERNYLQKKHREEEKRKVEETAKACNSILAQYNSLMESKLENSETLTSSVAGIHAEVMEQVIVQLKSKMLNTDASLSKKHVEQLQVVSSIV
jgi:iron-sulfur cluster repair protein YtfE (RIC family)